MEFAEFFAVDRWDPWTFAMWIRDEAVNPLPVILVSRTQGADTGFHGLDLLIEGGRLTARIFRDWPDNAIAVRTTGVAVPKDEWTHVTWTYDGSSTTEGLMLYANGQRLETEVLAETIWKHAVAESYEDGDLRIGWRFRDRGFRDGAIDDFHVYSRALTPLEVAHLHNGNSLGEAVADPESHEDALRDYYFSSLDPETRELQAELTKTRNHFVKTEDTIQEVSVMRELPEPRPTHILARGEYDAPRSEENRVTRLTPEFLPAYESDAEVLDRRDLAQWLTTEDHPLTARVFVNRLWANFFGSGLVTTVDDFGLQGAVPSHPDLLDWLARDFVDSGWDVKRLCRTIVLTATYRQDSRQREDLAEVDPANALLARGPSHRLGAEQVRDLALAAADLLDTRVGGPPVSPYQPGGDLWRESNKGSPPYKQSSARTSTAARSTRSGSAPRRSPT